MTSQRPSLGGISLNTAGLVSLADLTAISKRTALRGNASWLDILFIAPGIHLQQRASEVNKGEYPICGAMTTDYVFRVENQATVAFLQKIGKTGHLTVVKVGSESKEKNATIRKLKDFFAPPNLASSLLISLGISMTIAAITLVIIAQDWWALGVLGMLALARLINTIVLKRRAEPGWRGALEPGVEGDLLVLLSQDRWVRIQGLVDDLKFVTAGQWLRDQDALESFSTAFATLLVYISAVFVPNASTVGALTIIVLSLVSAGLLGLANYFTKDQTMFGRSLRVSTEPPKRYGRRLEMANELIEASGRNGWAIAMGLIVPKNQDIVRVSA